MRTTDERYRVLIRYMLLSLATALATMVIKGVAALITGSVGLLSDALESLVNLTAAIVAMMKNTRTWGPPILRSLRLAPKPIVVKKAIMSGSRRVVSNVNRLTSNRRATRMARATTSPPTTGAGML